MYLPKNPSIINNQYRFCAKVLAFIYGLLVVYKYKYFKIWGKVKTTIEINGKLYDAHTGKILNNPKSSTPSAASKPAATHKPKQPVVKSGVVMDGISRHKAATPVTPKSTTRHTQANKTTKAANLKQKNQHTTVEAQKSQTLNRKAVKKPAVTQKPHTHSTSANLHSSVEKSATGRGVLLKKIPASRLTRAAAARKSSLVSKYGKSAPNKPMLSQDFKVQKTPVHHNAKTKPINPITHPAQHPATKPTHKTSSSPSRNVFEENLAKANNHKMPAVKKPRSSRHRLARKLKVSPRVVSVVAGVFAIILLSGFFAYQRVPEIGIRIAANNAGFDAKLPGDVPAGYAFEGPIKAEQDKVTVSYKSGSDERSFTLEEKPSSWSSEALLTNFLLDSNNHRYQSYSNGGMTVYIYNGSNATWVDQGVWYSVTSADNTLSSEQLLDIASSI